MIEVKLFLCSDSAAIDARTNAVSAFQIMEQVNAPSFPIVIPRMSIIATLTRGDEDAGRHLSLEIDCGGQQLFSGPFPINLSQPTARAVVELQGFVVPGPQPLHLLLKVEQETLSTWTIKMNQVGKMPMQMSFHAPLEPKTSE